jgi:hypothetical protein
MTFLAQANVLTGPKTQHIQDTAHSTCLSSFPSGSCPPALLLLLLLRASVSPNHLQNYVDEVSAGVCAQLATDSSQGT